MSKKLLSLAVPTYNMEAYLRQCLDSVTREDVPDTLEVIVVNDGSKDSSLEIARSYEQKRPDIVRVIDKANGHYGSCINAGMDAATGKFFRPLDADDWFDTDSLIGLLKSLESVEADLVLTPYVEEFPDHSRVVDLKSVQAWARLPKMSMVSVLGECSDMVKMHSMAYNLEFLRKQGLRMQEGICYTDTEYFLLPLNQIMDFVYLPYVLYHYRLDRPGQTVNMEAFKKCNHHLALVLKKVLAADDLQPSSLCYDKLREITGFYYSIMLFGCDGSEAETQDMRDIEEIILDRDPRFWARVNKSLHGALRFWKLTGRHLTRHPFLARRVFKFKGL